MIVFLHCLPTCDIELAATSSIFLSSEVYLRWRSSDWYFWLAGDSVIKVITHCSAEGFTFGRVVLLKGELFRLSFLFFFLGVWGVQGQQITLVMLGKDSSKQLHDLFFYFHTLDCSLQQFDHFAPVHGILCQFLLIIFSQMIFPTSIPNSFISNGATSDET